MAFGATPVDANSVPLGSVYVPGVGFVALQGSTTTNTDGSSNQSTGVVAASVAATTGGTNDFHLISAATTNATVIKASAGQVYGYEIYNNNAAARFVKLYNKATTPTVGTDTVLRTIGIAPNSRISFHNTVGIVFSAGISIGTATGIADNSSTAVGASDLSIEIDWL